MTKSIQKRQKQLRKQSKPHTPYSQAQRYWPKEIRNRDRLKDDLMEYER